MQQVTEREGLCFTGTCIMLLSWSTDLALSAAQGGQHGSDQHDRRSRLVRPIHRWKKPAGIGGSLKELAHTDAEAGKDEVWKLRQGLYLTAFSPQDTSNFALEAFNRINEAHPSLRTIFKVN